MLVTASACCTATSRLLWSHRKLPASSVARVLRATLLDDAKDIDEFDHATTFLLIGTTQPLHNCAARLLLQGGQLEHHNCVHGFR